MRTISLLIALLLVSAPAAAQPSGEFQFDVPFRWTQSEGEAVDRQQDVGVTLGLEHLLAGERVRLFYDLDMDTFGAGDSLRTWLHNTGAVITLGPESHAVDIGGSVFWRANEGTWADAGFKGVNVLTSGRLRPRAGLTLAGSYALYARGFSDEPALDQVEHYGSLRILANLKTRTTLVGLVSAGRKRYDGRALEMVYEDPAPSPTLPGGRGWRRGMFLAPRVEATGESGVRKQWSWAARLAQSLDDRTGIWIEREERRTGGELPPAIVWTPPLFYDDGVYDDPYVIDARTWRAGARHVFATGHELSGWGSRSGRHYAGLLRHDVLTRLGVEALVPLFDAHAAAFELLGRYTSFRNESSDTLESYRAHQVSIGMRIAF